MKAVWINHTMTHTMTHTLTMTRTMTQTYTHTIGNKNDTKITQTIIHTYEDTHAKLKKNTQKLVRWKVFYTRRHTEKKHNEYSHINTETDKHNLWQISNSKKKQKN